MHQPETIARRPGPGAQPRVQAPNTVRTRDGVDLFYRDWGSGRPVVFVASWSMPSESWSYQMLALQEAGCRAIAFDRCGHGRSGDPGGGYDFDTLADDLAAVLDALDLRDAVLVGHSMGCNEIVRYLARHGCARVAGAVLLATMTPFVLKTPDNPGGIDASVFEEVRRTQLMADLPRWIDDNMEPFLLPETARGTLDGRAGGAAGNRRGGARARPRTAGAAVPAAGAAQGRRRTQSVHHHHHARHAA